MRQDNGMSNNTGCPPGLSAYTSSAEIHTPNSSESDAMTPNHSHHALEEMHQMMELY
jgi:hypothetical protein